ncbi:MAG: hypothetical protein JST93_14455 [Acidobacteria bacterium]|nr:hypothetical protein [Acidobacteriota bacterium]
MRFALALLALGFIPAFSQQRGMYGGVSTGQMVGSINSTGFASGLGATVSSLPQTGRVIPMGPGVYSNPVRSPGNNWSPRGARTVAIPWGLPITTGYYPTVPEYVPVPVQQQVQPAPAVIINQYYSPEQVRPELKEYSDLPEARAHAPARPAAKSAAPPAPANPEQAVDSSKPTITLLAFKDSTVVAAIAYWEQADEIHYVTNNFSKRIVPVSSLDKVLSEQLNKERKVEFKLESMR